MAYDKDKTFNEVIEAIEIHKLKHFYQIEAFIVPTCKTLIEWGWNESGEGEKCEAIKEALDQNKIMSKVKMVNSWENSDNPTLQIAAFKLIATDEERKALSTNWNNNEHSGEITTKTNIIVQDSETAKDLKKLIDGHDNY